jgi:hypothetical protein
MLTYFVNLTDIIELFFTNIAQLVFQSKTKCQLSTQLNELKNNTKEGRNGLMKEGRNGLMKE